MKSLGKTGHTKYISSFDAVFRSGGYTVFPIILSIEVPDYVSNIITGKVLFKESVDVSDVVYTFNKFIRYDIKRNTA